MEQSSGERESGSDDAGAGQSPEAQNTSQSFRGGGGGRSERLIRTNERLTKAWGSATGWAPPSDKFKFSIDDLSRAGINLRDNVSRVTAKARKYKYPLSKLWEPEGLFHELAFEQGSLRRHDDGRVLVQAKLFHRAAALADEWFTDKLEFVPCEDGSLIVTTKGGGGGKGGLREAGAATGRVDDGVEGEKARTATTKEVPGHRRPLPSSAAKRRVNESVDAMDEDKDEVLDVDGSGAPRRRGSGAAAGDVAGDERRQLQQQQQPRLLPSAAAIAATAKAARTRTPLPTGPGSRKSGAAAGTTSTTRDSDAGLQPKRAWTTINQQRSPASAAPTAASMSGSIRNEPRLAVRNPPSLKRRHPSSGSDPDDDESDNRADDGDDDDDGDGDGPTTSKKVKRQCPPRLTLAVVEECLRDEFDFAKLRWALDFVREAADVVVQKTGLAAYPPGSKRKALAAVSGSGSGSAGSQKVGEKVKTEEREGEGEGGLARCRALEEDARTALERAEQELGDALAAQERGGDDKDNDEDKDEDKDTAMMDTDTDTAPAPVPASALKEPASEAELTSLRQRVEDAKTALGEAVRRREDAERSKGPKEEGVKGEGEGEKGGAAILGVEKEGEEDEESREGRESREEKARMRVCALLLTAAGKGGI